MYRPVLLAAAAITATGMFLLSTAQGSDQARRGQRSADRGATSCDSIGADVIVGELPSMANYTRLGDIDAFSVATTSCNIGDELLLWEADNSLHPVIGQHLYRIKDGRFEQIGQSWLKHGFLALAQDACGCGCENPNDGSRLGIGCSDPYGAALNGTQNGLGPKFEVNANTGVFPFPATDLSETGNSIFKRLQVHVDDLDPALNSDAIYYVEGHYVTPDDAAAGNQDNNASFREVLVSGTDEYNLNVAGSTQRERPAILGWQDVHPDVVITEVTDPQGGRIIAGMRAWQQTGQVGTWEYEFAIHNLNSDLSIGSVTIPVDPEATLTNIGFNDVDYHSGEPFDGTDWPATYTPGDSAITWSTEDFATNANANAVRWGTTYNFRFTANRPPQTAGDASMGWFKPVARRGATDVTFTAVAPLAIPPADCNANGIDDQDDIAAGTSADCNLNFIPDDCEAFDMPLLKKTEVASGLSQPVGVYAPSGDEQRLFIVEQTGAIRILDLAAGTVNPIPFLEFGVGGLHGISTGGERGLLGLAFHPDYNSNGKFYVNYTNTDGDTVVSEFTVSGDPDIADNTSETIIRTIVQDFSNHNGGCIAFGPDEMLYVGMGDGGSANDPLERAQDDASLLGKMLRLDVDNSGGDYLPGDNPGGDWLPEVWAKGLRNPWRFDFDDQTGDLYIADVGQDAWEEINFQPASSPGGENYGWRCWEGNVVANGGNCPDAADVTFPVFSIAHGDQGTGSISGGAVYRGCSMPGMSGRYFFADFLGDYIKSFRIVDGVATDVMDHTSDLGGVNAVVAIGEDGSGEIYIVSISGTIYRIEDDTPGPITCGNGVVEPGEQCDPPNSATCDCNCQLVPENILLLDDFESDQGWTTDDDGAATSGFWQRGIPVDDAGWAYDPIADSDGSGRCYVTENGPGNTDIDMGAVSLFSPVIDMSAGSVSISYAYFLRLTNSDGADMLLVEISENGASGPWTEIARHDTDGGLSWRTHVITQGDLDMAGITKTTSMMLRFTANDANTQSIVEAGVDAVQVFTDAFYSDCNDNCIDDALDIANATSFDCNGNSIPDECEATVVTEITNPVTPPLDIPDETGEFVSDTVNVAESGTIEDLDIDLTIVHTWNGDLTVRLSHGGTTVVLIDRPGYTGSGSGFDNDGFNITLDDEGAGGSIENVDSPAGVISPPSYVPNEALSAFDGMDMAGDWTIEVSDSAGSDLGQLTYWALRVSMPGDVDPCDCDGNGVDDTIDLLENPELDCNSNGVLDSCDIASGSSSDFAGGPVGNIAAGESLLGMNCSGCHGVDGAGGSGLPGPNLRNRTRDFIWNRLLPPTDHPGGARPDFTQQNFADLEAFLDDDGSSGARPDMIPDECQPDLVDCDGDGIPDAEELAKGTQVDANYDGTPDDCPVCEGDTDNDGLVDLADLLNVLANWGTTDPAGDADNDGDVDLGDLLAVLSNWGGC